MRQIEPNTFICADNMDVLRDIPDGFCDLCLTDPPYGIGIAAAGKVGGNNLAAATDYGAVSWDNCVPDVSFFDEMRRVSKHQVVWGGNYFAAALGNSPGWLVWDKQCTGNFADCELAYTSFGFAVRRFYWMWNGMLQQQMGDLKEQRYHPTQKPVPLFVWALQLCSKPGDLIIDPFCGSGTTALACHKTGRRFICIDREQKYIDIAQQRYKDLIAQQDLFGADIMESGAQAYNTQRAICPQISMELE